jgi:hypothetical protein
MSTSSTTTTPVILRPVEVQALLEKTLQSQPEGYPIVRVNGHTRVRVERKEGGGYLVSVGDVEPRVSLVDGTNNTKTYSSDELIFSIKGTGQTEPDVKHVTLTTKPIPDTPQQRSEALSALGAPTCPKSEQTLQKDDPQLIGKLSSAFALLKGFL